MPRHRIRRTRRLRPDQPGAAESTPGGAGPGCCASRGRRALSLTHTHLGGLDPFVGVLQEGVRVSAPEDGAAVVYAAVFREIDENLVSTKPPSTGRGAGERGGVWAKPLSGLQENLLASPQPLAGRDRSSAPRRPLEKKHEDCFAS